MATASKDFRVKNGIVAGSTVVTPASTTARSSIRVPHGTEPTTPVDGDMWSTVDGLYMFVNGGVVGPYIAGSVGTTVEISETAPAGVTGGLWYKDSTNQMFLYSGAAWEELQNKSITLSGDVSGSGTDAITVTITDDSHNHTSSTISDLDAGDTTTGIFAIGRIPTGSTGTTVSLGNHTHSYQPLDTDLTNIAALTGTSGFLKTNGASVWSVDTATYLTSATGVTTVNGSSGAISNVALTTGKLSQFAATTSAELAGVLSDETGFSAGALAVFNISPSIATSITTTSTTQFDLVNTTVTGTVNIAGAAGTVNLGNASGTVSIPGNLTVGGTTTTINSTTLTVDDKNIELGSVAAPTDITADGGGITLRGTTDKTIIWDNANDNWTFNQNVNLATGFSYKINNVAILTATTLNASVTSAAGLTTVGTITSGTWSGAFGAVSGANLTSLTAGNLSGTIPSGVLANSTINIGTTGIALNRASAALTLAGLTLTTPVIDSISAAGTANAISGWGNLTTGSISIGAGLTTGSLQLAAVGTGATPITIGHTNATIAIIGNTTVTGTLAATSFSGSGASLTSIPNGALTNSSVTVNGTAIALGASGTVTAAAGTLTGATLNATVTGSSLTSVGTITSGVWNAGAVTSSGGISGTTGTFSSAMTVQYLNVTRQDASFEGGEIALKRAVDNVTGFTIDVYGNTTSPQFRIFNDGATKIWSLSTAGDTSVPGNLTALGTFIAPAGTTTVPSLRIPHGSAPTTPTNGDVWTTTAGVYARINGVTVGPFGAGSGGASISDTAPGSPVAGQIWFDSTTTKTYVYYDSHWIQVGGGAIIATNLIGGNTTTLLGSMPYQSAVDTTTMLAPNTSATRAFLGMTGTGTNGAAPTWTTSTGTGSVVLATSPTTSNLTNTGLLTVQDGATADASPGLRIAGVSGIFDFYNALSGGSYNGLVAVNDKAIIFNDGTIDTGNLVIGPHSAAATGIKISAATQTVRIGALLVDLQGVADTATTATHYFVETATDGYIRPKTLANVRTEVVTTAAVNAAAATTVGTITSGVWNAGAITSSGAGAFTSTISASGLAGSLLTATVGTTLGTAAAGTSAIPARSDHVHPTEYPTQTGNSGKFLQTNGTSTSWQSAGAFYQATAPTAATGLIWVDSDTDTQFIYNGTAWVRPIGLETNAQAAGWTLALTDVGKVIEMSGGGTLTVNSTVAFKPGTQITILQTGASQVTIAGAGTYVVNATPGLKLRAQWSSATLLYRGSNNWVAFGDLVA